MKSINIKLDEKMVEDIKGIAKIYNKSMTDVIKEALSNIITEKKNDFYYKLTNFPECSEEETKEIVDMLNNLSDDDLVTVRKEVIEI